MLERTQQIKLLCSAHYARQSDVSCGAARRSVTAYCGLAEEHDLSTRNAALQHGDWSHTVGISRHFARVATLDMSPLKAECILWPDTQIQLKSPKRWQVVIEFRYNSALPKWDLWM